MKRIILVPFVLLLLSFAANSQSTDSTKTDSTMKRHKKVPPKTYTSKPSQAVYLEAGGNSVIYSVNYDRRFTKRLDGLGFRVGAGYFKLGEYNITAFPLGINFLTGAKGNFVETALNITAVTSKFTGTPSGVIPEASFGQIDFSKDKLHWIYSIALGYRYQPTKSGFNFRAGIEPVLGKRFDEKWVFAITGHISAGFTF